LAVADVEKIIAQAVETAQRANRSITVALTDREGNVLGVFAMNGSSGTATGSIAKARTAAFLSSNQHGFTTLTACYITRPHFPPGVQNTAGGPLYGVPFSSLFNGDVQPNGAGQTGQPGLVGAPGGVPLYKNECLVGGVGVTGAPAGFQLATCSGVTEDEIIALGASLGYSTPTEKQGDKIFIDGIRFLYANAPTPQANFALNFSTVNVPSIGVVDPAFPIRTSPPPRFPHEGEVNLDSALHDFRIRSGSLLTAGEVQRIVTQAAAQAAQTRAAIRTPAGVSAQVFISVVDTNGSILGIWRTPDASMFSFDVSAQKARTALAFSNPANVDFCGRVRSLLGLSPGQSLAMSTRAVGFLSQDFFPPGIDMTNLGNPVEPGPLYEGPEFAYQARLASEAGLPAYGNGITIFPGGLPLYKGGRLAGAIGVSGDGVDQDDLIAFAGAQGFHPPDDIRSDQYFYRGVRLPYAKFPRRPGT
jgi:uncharacterized protein GlcG (DUF336 family)